MKFPDNHKVFFSDRVGEAAFVLFFAIHKYTTIHQCVSEARKPREANKAYVNDYLKYLSLNKRIKTLSSAQKMIKRWLNKTKRANAQKQRKKEKI